MGRKLRNLDRERVELRASKEWIDEVLEVSKSLGLSLSAYIRLRISEAVRRDKAVQIHFPEGVNPDCK